MGHSKEQLLARLQELQIDFARSDHPVVMTVEAQAKYVGNIKGALCKNLFLKDKKNRFYIVSALSETKVDLKVLSQRLGLGKGGLRMAPEEAFTEVLQVPLGSVTPFALVNESARHVSLVLDRGLKTQERCIFHPLSNDTSIALNARDLDKFLNSIGKTLAYVDLEANPPIGKDQPPDLAALVPSDAIVLPDLPEKASLLQGHEHSGHKLHNDIPTNNKSIIPAVVKSVKPSVDSQKKSTNVLGLANSFADPNKFVEEVLEKTSAIILSEIKVENAKQDGEQLGTALVADLRKRLSEELKSMATMFKNVAYTEGFAAGTCNQPKRL
ncbi:uncharacterized protein LOC116027279 isoform X1 [Ipomoea triloba]|uniref:uncharacterized protein LOC116027279 isoform X1 n=1 Tax=Ipomoea triloba TaxID=35885 RepID=UPI00125DCF5D|nr:uncharacterized protein LOC116027279 isoform X1 [Ipomoea triloba]